MRPPTGRRIAPGVGQPVADFQADVSMRWGTKSISELERSDDYSVECRGASMLQVGTQLMAGVPSPRVVRAGRVLMNMSRGQIRDISFESGDVMAFAYRDDRRRAVFERAVFDDLDVPTVAGCVGTFPTPSVDTESVNTPGCDSRVEPVRIADRELGLQPPPAKR